MAREDGPGSSDFGTTAAYKKKHNTEKNVQSLGSVKNENATRSAETIQKENFSPAPTVYKYPLDGAADFPAMMQFKVRTVDAYTVDTAEYAQYYDAPLITKGWNALTKSEAVQDQETVEEGDFATTTNNDGDFDDAEAEDTPTGSVNQFELNRPPAKRGSVNQFELNRVASAKAEEASKQDRNPRRDGATGLKTMDPVNPVVIRIYMPQSLVVNDDISYNQENLGTRGLVASAAMNNGSGILGAIGNAVAEGLESVFNLATGQITRDTANVAAARISQKIPSAGLRAAASTALQTGVNPGTRMIFDRPNIRQFTFQFRFIATSAAEASQVESIIKSFRTEMYPEAINIAEGIPAGYRFPNLFEISFKFLNSQAKFPKIQLAYLRSCQVNYNGSQMVFHADGQPTEVDMTLIFQEYRALAKQDIERGY
jgi:hypothetical protein